MGRYIKGILGGFSGKIGNIIGGKWKGIHYMRSLSDTRSNEPTEKQIIHRAKFSFASRFLQPLQPVLKVGFRTQDKNRSPQNAAMSDLMRNVIEGDYPSYRVNFEKLRISKGSLVVANAYQVELADGQINFTWTDTPEIAKSYGNNLALLVATGEDIYPTYSFTEILRSEQSGSIPVPTGVPGTKIYCYLAFAHEDLNREVSNSKLAGIITLA
ncbi:hypothetical protein DMA11_22420 [Marinilabiliaceae bacterium JC017]|nr:hypothetical protein DMA11_22420 [Marinilabiliaceae bacterium JC017]